MKNKISLLPMIFFASIAIAQETPLSFSEVVQVDSSISKNTLFERARGWLNDVFRDYKEVSQIQDKESGELSVKGVIFTYYQKNTFGQPLSNYPCNVRLKITIWVKDGRYKYEFSNYDDSCMGELTTKEIYKESGAQKNYINNQWNESKKGATDKTTGLIQLLKSEMSSASQENNDW